MFRRTDKIFIFFGPGYLRYAGLCVPMRKAHTERMSDSALATHGFLRSVRRAPNAQETPVHQLRRRVPMEKNIVPTQNHPISTRHPPAFRENGLSAKIFIFKYSHATDLNAIYHVRYIASCFVPHKTALPKVIHDKTFPHTLSFDCIICFTDWMSPGCRPGLYSRTKTM